MQHVALAPGGLKNSSKQCLLFELGYYTMATSGQHTQKTKRWIQVHRGDWPAGWQAKSGQPDAGTAVRKRGARFDCAVEEILCQTRVLVIYTGDAHNGGCILASIQLVVWLSFLWILVLLQGGNFTITGQSMHYWKRFSFPKRSVQSTLYIRPPPALRQ